MKIITLAVLGLTSLASSAMAVELTGGSVKLEYSAFADDIDLSRFGLEGSLELAFTRNFSLQADLGYQSFNESNLDSTIFGLHGIFHLDDLASFGAYYTRDDFDGGDVDIVGVEAGYEFSGFEVEGYLSYADAGGADGGLYGISGRYEFANAVGVTGAFDRFDEGDFDLNLFSVTIDRDVTPNVNLFVEAGAGEAGINGIGNSDFEAFVGIGGKVAFGNKRGATFEQRSLSGLIPGL